MPLHEDVMVALHDTSGAVVPGYEKEACVFTHVDGTRLPLAWCGTALETVLQPLISLRPQLPNAA